MYVVQTYVGRDDFFVRLFFQEKIVAAKIHLLLFEFRFTFKFRSFTLLKGRQTPLSNSKIVKVTINVIGF